MKKIIYVFIFMVFFLPSFVYADDEKIEVTFSKCVDGDTAKFKINDEIKSVRFLAIDTPETVHPTKKEEKFGKEASNYTCDKLKNAKKIVIEYDENSTKTDKYDRVLAWVFVDDILLQEKLIENGYAKLAYLYGDYKYVDKLKIKEETAKNNRIGIWQETDDKSNSKVEDSNGDYNKIKKIIGNQDEIYKKLVKIAKKVLKKLENML